MGAVDTWGNNSNAGKQRYNSDNFVDKPHSPPNAPAVTAAWMYSPNTKLCHSRDAAGLLTMSE